MQKIVKNSKQLPRILRFRNLFLPKKSFPRANFRCNENIFTKISTKSIFPMSELFPNFRHIFRDNGKISRNGGNIFVGTLQSSHVSSL